jgi:hypothetical protein
MKYKAIVFDVDNTLAKSKLPLTPDMAALLSRLAKVVPVAATTGTSYNRFEEMVFPYLANDMPLQNFYLLPTSGAAFYAHDGEGWKTIYKELLTEEQMLAAETAIEKAIVETGIELGDTSYGPRTERRHDTSVNFAGLGQLAPLELKLAWDPDRVKRWEMTNVIAPLLPWAVVRPAGTTTINITRKGIDKDYGIRKLSDHLGIPLTEMLYVGDALFPGGDDEIVKKTGIETQLVENPEHTMRIIEELLSSS